MIVTIVMYHYVRRAAESPCPRLNALDTGHFLGQLDYLIRHHTIIGGQQLVAALRHGRPLPERPALLTFDDGYLDHVRTVLPILQRHRVPGVFFPPARAVSERRVLDVNKVHYVLATVENTAPVIAMIESFVATHAGRPDILDPAEYRRRYGVPNRFDGAEVNYVKRMLQLGLPADIRSGLVDAIFREVVGRDEAAVADELYMTEDQVRALVAAGMTVGSHGYAHEWMDSLDPADQEREVDLGLDFLDRVGVDRRDWLMCYPYGASNGSLLDILRRKGCAAAFVSRPGLAELDDDDPLLLARLDTNDLPKEAGAAPCSWTERAFAARVPA